MIAVRDFGYAAYEPVYAEMRELAESRTSETPDQFWIVEHPPVFTLGLAAERAHLLRDVGIPVIQTDRGGEITYHGPGQAVIYLLMDLKRQNRDHRFFVREFVHHIEQAVIDTLAQYAVVCERHDGAPGIYLADGPKRGAKIAALGLKVSRHGYTYHGLALNVAMDLTPFSAINPCGYAGMNVVDLRSMGVSLRVGDAHQALIAQLQKQFG